MVNFRIVEGEDDVDFEKFKSLFFDPYKKVDDICEEMNISRKRYTHLRDDLIDEMGVYIKKPVAVDLPFKNKPMRYISCLKNGRYSVNKQINHHKYSFGSYTDLDTAKEVRDHMEAHNWDEDEYQRFRLEMKRRNHKNPYSEDEYRRVRKDYLDGYNMDEIIERNRVTPYKYSCISKRVRTEENLFSKPRRRV